MTSPLLGGAKPSRIVTRPSRHTTGTRRLRAASPAGRRFAVALLVLSFVSASVPSQAQTPQPLLAPFPFVKGWGIYATTSSDQEFQSELKIDVKSPESSVVVSHTLHLAYVFDSTSRQWVASISERLPKGDGNFEYNEIAHTEYTSAFLRPGLWQVSASARVSGRLLAYKVNVPSPGDPLALYANPVVRQYRFQKVNEPYAGDGLKYVYHGVHVAYDHPDRMAYDLNPRDWRTLVGHAFYHIQMSKNIDVFLRLPPQIVGMIITAVLGFIVAPGPVKGVASVLGGIIGLVLGSVGQYAIEQYLRDEDGAVWLWIKKSDWDSLIRTAQDYQPRTVEFLKIGELGPMTFSIPSGVLDLGVALP